MVITEYSADIEPNSKNFPHRNRIISGISLGVLVVEAKNRSGASLTANIAKGQGRKAFCIPASLDSKYIRTNELIREGAILVNCVDDILQEFNLPKSNSHESDVGAGLASAQNVCNKSNFVKRVQICTPTIPPEYMGVYKTLSQEPIHINQICKILNDNISNVGSILTMLELEDFVEQFPGKMFRIK